MTLGRNGYVQPVEIVAAGVGPARNGWVQPVEIIGGGGGGGAVGDIVDATGSTTDSYVAVTGFPVSRSDGLVGIGSILNTGANGMNVRETVTDKFGNTQSVTTVVAAGDEYMLDLQTNFANAAFPPFTDYTVEVESSVSGDSTDYELHFIDITPGAGGGGGTETLEQARANGDTFTGGDVYWDVSNALNIGISSAGGVNTSYLQILSLKVDSVHVLSSRINGTEPAPWPIAIQMSGLDIARFSQTVALTLYNEVDPSKGVSFDVNSAGDMSVSASAGDQFAFQQSLVGSNLSLEVNNLDAGNTASGAKLRMSVGGTGAGDPFLTWVVVGGTTRSFGLDNSDSDILKLTDGASPSAGTTLLSIDASGNTFILGKLTVTGAIDPTSLSLSGSAEGANVLYLDSANGVSAAVAPANHGRLRYNNTSKTWQQSVDGGAYSDIGSGGGSSPWQQETIGTTPADVIDQVDETELVIVGDTTAFNGGNDWDQYSFNVRGGAPNAAGLVVGISSAANAVQGPAFVGLKSRGTLSSPSVLSPGDRILSIYAAGYSTSRLRDCGQLHFYAGGGWAAGGSTDCPTLFRISTVLDGDGVTLSDRLVIDDNGLATFSHGIETGDDVTVNGTLHCTTLDAGSLSFSTITLTASPSIITMNTMAMTAITAGPDGNTYSFVDVDTIQLGKSQADANQRAFLYRKNDGSAGGGMYLSGLSGTPTWTLFVGGEGGGNVELTVTDAGATFGADVTATGKFFGAGGSGGTAQTSFLAANGKSFAGKTSGGTACDLVMLYSDNVLYIGDGNVSGGIAFPNIKMGFFNTAPQSKPTGVAVTAAGIHAALVTLGLIAA